jgi:hypothetical protein
VVVILDGDGERDYHGDVLVTLSWTRAHVKTRYLSGDVAVIPLDHRGYVHRAMYGAECVTLRGQLPPLVCDCGLFALDWTSTPSTAAVSAEGGEKE